MPGRPRAARRPRRAPGAGRRRRPAPTADAAPSGEEATEHDGRAEVPRRPHAPARTWRRSGRGRRGDARRASELFFEPSDSRSGRRSASSTASSTRRWSGPRTTTTSCRIAEQIADLVPVSPFWLDYARHDGNGAVPVAAPRRRQPQLHRDDVRPVRARPAVRGRQARRQVRRRQDDADPGRPGRSPSTRRSARPTAPDGKRADPRQPELLPPRRPLPRGERREVRQVRHRRVRRPHRLRLPGRRHQPDLVAAEADACCCNCRSGRSRSPNGQFTEVVPLDLEPYRTQTIDYLFYFPTAGQVRALPGPRRRRTSSSSRPRSRSRSTWSTKPTKLDTTSWDYVSQHGTDEEVLAFLEPRERARP